MSRLIQYWSSINNKGLRLLGAFTMFVGLLLLMNNPPGGTWNHIGGVLDLVGIVGLLLVVFLDKRA